MKLSKLIYGAPNIEVSELFFDSRKKVKRGVFFAIEGLNVDGHQYVDQAIENGAIAVVYSNDTISLEHSAVYIKVSDVSEALAKCANRFYNYPSDKMKVIGITGTNGKTTIASILNDVLNKQSKCGYIGTLNITYGDKVFPPQLTTPDAISLQYHLSEMYKEKVDYVAMEVSSHGLELGRVDGVDFDIAIFSNLTHDHLDFHGTFENYFKAKSLLFTNLKPGAKAILNRDDQYFEELNNLISNEVVTYAIQQPATYQATDIELTPSHTQFTLVAEEKKYAVRTNLVATYNIYNLLAAISCLHQIGFSIEYIIENVQVLQQVEGRMERIDLGQNFNVIVDFAHTPDGLVKMFEYARAISPQDDNVIAVFGSAGRRDISKRKMFGEIADKYCDKIILTEDDPRDDSVKEIANQIKEGIENTNTIFIEDRYAAIRLAIESANTNDTVLILGKGNEQFMYRKDGKSPYKGDHIIAKEVIEQYILNDKENTDETK